MPDTEPKEEPKKPAPKKDWVQQDKISKRIDKEVVDARDGE